MIRFYGICTYVLYYVYIVIFKPFTISCLRFFKIKKKKERLIYELALSSLLLEFNRKIQTIISYE